MLKGESSVPGDLWQPVTLLARYGLITEQKKGTYKYFIDLGDRMEVATSRTVYVDEVRQISSISGVIADVASTGSSS